MTGGYWLPTLLETSHGMTLPWMENRTAQLAERSLLKEGFLDIYMSQMLYAGQSACPSVPFLSDF